MKRIASFMMLTMLLLSTFILAYNAGMVQTAQAKTDYIDSEGIISSSLAPISAQASSQQAQASSGPPIMQWNQTYGGTGIDEASCVIQTGDGGYALAGITGSFGAGGEDAWLVKTDAAGNMQWSQTYGGKGLDGVSSVVQTGDGGYALAGITLSFGIDSIWLVKTDPSGIMQWNKTYGGTGPPGVCFASCVIQLNDGGYALACNGPDLLKTDAAGNLQWNKTYGNGLMWSVIQTNDGGYALAGVLGSDIRGYDFWLVKADSNGNLQLNETFRGVLSSEALSVVQTGDGGYALAGWTNFLEGGGGSADFWLVKTDSAGNVQWNQTYGGPGGDYAYSVVQTGDGGYALGGWTNSFGGSADFWLVKTDSAGNVQWNQTYGGPDADVASSMIQARDGGYALAGYTVSSGAGSYDFLLVKTAGASPSSPGFAMYSTSPFYGVTAGGNTSFVIHVKYGDGFSEIVTLSCQDLPNGCSAQFDIDELSPPVPYRTLTVATASTLSNGTYTFLVKGESGDTYQEIPVTLTVGTGTITGMVYEDDNGNGVRDHAESVVSGATLGFYATKDYVNLYVATATSDSRGEFVLRDVPFNVMNEIDASATSLTMKVTPVNIIDHVVTQLDIGIQPPTTTCKPVVVDGCEYQLKLLHAPSGEVTGGFILNLTAANQPAYVDPKNPAENYYAMGITKRVIRVLLVQEIASELVDTKALPYEQIFGQNPTLESWLSSASSSSLWYGLMPLTGFSVSLDSTDIWNQRLALMMNIGIEDQHKIDVSG